MSDPNKASTNTPPETKLSLTPKKGLKTVTPIVASTGLGSPEQSDGEDGKSVIELFQELMAVQIQIDPKDLHWGDYISKFDMLALLDLSKNLDLINQGSKILGLGMAGRLTSKKINNSKLKEWKIKAAGKEMGPTEFAKYVLEKGANLAGLTQVVICASKIFENEDFLEEHPEIEKEDCGSLFPLEKEQLCTNMVVRYHKAHTLRGYNPPTLQVCLEQVNFARSLLGKEKVSLQSYEVDELYFRWHGERDISSKLNQGVLRNEDTVKSSSDNETARKKNVEMREALEKMNLRKV